MRDHELSNAAYLMEVLPDHRVARAARDQVGIDVSKDRLDVAVRPSGKRFAVPRTRRARRLRRPSEGVEAEPHRARRHRFDGRSFGPESGARVGNYRYDTMSREHVQSSSLNPMPPQPPIARSFCSTHKPAGEVARSQTFAGPLRAAAANTLRRVAPRRAALSADMAIRRRGA